MIFSADNDNLYKDSYGYSSSTEGTLMKILSVPLPSLGMAVSSSSFVSPSLISFEDPFDDPSMEPLPLGSNTSSGHQAPIVQSNPSSGHLIPIVQSMDDAASSESLFVADDCLSPSTMKLNKPLTCNLSNDLSSLCDPVVDTVGTKRTSGDPFSNHAGPCKRQRTNSVHYALSEESRARFRPYQETQWRAQFQKLSQYKLENGHCCVPRTYPDDPALARWAKRQRYQYKKLKDCDPTSTMTTLRIQGLELIGFVWHSHEAAWLEKLYELKAFKQSTGHCNVPSHYLENVALATWVKCQRRQYKLYVSGASSTLQMERFQLLESLGFVFDVSKRRARTTTVSNGLEGNQ